MTCYMLIFSGLLISSKLMVMTFAGLFGFFVFPTMPTMMELITRKYHDVPLHISNTFLVVSSQLITVVLQSVVGLIFDHAENSGPVVLLFVMIYFSLVLIFVMKIDDPRPEGVLIS